MPAPLRQARSAPAPTRGETGPRTGLYRVSISVESPQRGRLSQRWVRHVVRAALSQEGAAPNGRVEVLLAGDRTVKHLNVTYLGDDHVTDVLSFPSGESFPRPGPWREVGQIVLSLPQTERQARRARRPLGDEAAHLLAHGVLHLLGYDHAQPPDAAVMRSREEAVLRLLAVQSEHVHAEEEAPSTYFQ